MLKGKKGRKDYEEWKEEWWRKDISVVVSSEVVAKVFFLLCLDKTLHVYGKPLLPD